MGDTYRALVVPKICKTFDEALNSFEIHNLPRKPLGTCDVRVALKAAALNFFDLLMFVGKYQHRPDFPLVPCTEAAGVVTEVGSDVKLFKVGDRVCCGLQTACGGAAEETVVYEGFCHHLPDTLSFEQGAGFIVGYMTAYHGLVHRGNLKEGEYVLITGAAGGMGVAALQIAKLLGARVIVTAANDEKLKVLKSLGADYTINYNKENLKDRVQEITNGHFCDVIFESVGGSMFDACVRCIAGKGRLLVIGFASGDIPKLPVNLALIKGFSLVGVRAGAQLSMEPDLSKEMYDTLLSWSSQGRLQPHIGGSYPLEKAKEAFALMLTRQVIGKCVLIPTVTNSKL
eukprot:TRINITY_DN4341_c0_g1_i2.p1 TRINITY_DN4341_c0_g1~~TRINITY_DN4341_c0_g1_i2.p1  ORF type:complete len:363 (+),score=76.59 TRINITY_DN4341_c0_g1_i2:61-1089(+)